MTTVKNTQMLLKWSKRTVLVFVALALVYGVGRVIHVYSGSFYSGARAPYLMMPAPTAMTIRWQSKAAYRGVVRYGATPDALREVAQEKDADEEHEIRLTNLKPGQRYYYSVGPEQAPAYVGADYWFETSPLASAPRPLRVAVLGDPGYPNPIQDEVRDAMLDWLEENPRQQRPLLDLLLTTGDNAYRSGSNAQFQAGFFEPYAAILRNTPVWPVYGNHDARRWAFFDIFSFPENAESGGVASGTEHYYSFDYADVHFVILDSQASSLSPGSAMLEWLEQDLAATRQNWIISAFHHPPYSHGSHDSDDKGDSGGRMHALRENVLPLLEQGGVDLVLSGHSHMYERSYLLACHYGDSTSLQKDMMLDKSERSSYRKPLKRIPHQGTVYLVIGSSSKVDQGPLDHPAMAVSMAETGTLVVDIKEQKLSGRFITPIGATADYFEIVKDENQAARTAACGK